MKQLPRPVQYLLDRNRKKTTPASWKIQQKGPKDYDRDKAGKYTQYFQGNVILPIPEISKALEPWILSLVVTNLKTRRLTGMKKDTFEELRTAGIPCQYFFRRSFATWDVLLPTEEQAAKISGSNIMTKFFRFQPKHRGTRRVRVTVCNVPAFLTDEILASFLSANGRVEDVSRLRSTAGTVHGDYVFRICLIREGFQAIPHTILMQIPVEEVSLKLLCISTHHGLYKVERLPFGVNVAPAIFHQVMDTMLSGLDFAVAYLDDILMTNKGIIKHKKHFHKVFIKIQDYGFKLKRTNVIFSWKKSNTLVTLLTRMVDDQILNKLLH